MSEPAGDGGEARETGAETESDISSSMAAGLFRAAEELKETLTVSEAGFRSLAAASHRSSRDLILFEALDELQKLAFTCLQSLELCSGEEPDPEEATSRLASESVEDGTSLLQRKLIETLADLICLGGTPGEPYYRDFLLLAQLEDLLGAQKDMKLYYGSESRNIAHQADELGAEIQALEADGLDPSLAHYRRRRAAFDLPRARAGGLFASFSTRLERALELASDDEKASLGFSYGGGFGDASGDLHARPGQAGMSATLERARVSINTPIAIGVSVLVRCQKTLGQVPEGQNSWLRAVVDGNEGPAQLLEKGLRGKAQSGDIVMAYDHLGQVIEVAEGRFGYQSYLVRYLSRPPLPEIAEDWHLAQHVQLVLNPSKIRAMIESEAEKRPGERIGKLLELGDEELQSAIAEGIGAIEKGGGGIRASILAQARELAEES